MATVRNYNLQSVARRILREDCRAIQLGDSTGTNTNTPRWGESWVRKLNCTRWKGVVSYPGATGASQNGAQPFHVGAPLIPATGSGGTGNDGNTVPFPQGLSSEGVMTNTFQTHRRYFLNSTGTPFRNGDPWFGRTLTARFTWQQTTNAVAVMASQCWRGEADFTGTNTERTLATAGTAVGAQGVRYLDQAFGTLDASPSGGRREAAWASTFGDETGKYFHTGPVLFWVDDGLPGFQYDWIAAGGWKVNHHRVYHAVTNADGSYTDTQIDTHLACTRLPNTVIWAIGLNDADVDETEMLDAIDRWRQRINATGQTHLALLIAPWPASGDTTNADQRSDLFYSIAQRYADVAALDLNRILMNRYGGDWSALSTAILADGVHQSTAGIPIIGEDVNNALEAAASPSSSTALFSAFGWGWGF